MQNLIRHILYYSNSQSRRQRKLPNFCAYLTPRPFPSEIKRRLKPWEWRFQVKIRGNAYARTLSLRSSRLLSFSKRRSNKRAKKCASQGTKNWVSKNWGEVGRGERERRGGGQKRIRLQSILNILPNSTRVQNVCACARSLFSNWRLRMRTSQQECLFLS